MRCASERATELMEIISIVELLGAAAGTMIMVATRRNEANDNPSSISSSVMTSYAPAASSRSTPSIWKGMFERDDFPPRAHGHVEMPFAKKGPSVSLVRPFDPISYRFL